MPKSRKRTKAVRKAKQQRRAAAGSSMREQFVKSPWETWRGIRELVQAGEMEAVCLDIVENLPYRANGRAWVTLQKTADRGGITVEESVAAFENLERTGYMVWDAEANSAFTVIPEGAETIDIPIPPGGFTPEYFEQFTRKDPSVPHQITDDERALLTLVSRSPEPVSMSDFFPELNPAGDIREGHPGHEAWLERQLDWFKVTVSLHEKDLVEVVHPADGTRPDLVVVTAEGRRILTED